MILGKNYVFILGAGASMDFGFPSGGRLFEQVVRDMLNRSTDQYKVVSEIVGDEKSILDFATALSRSAQPSVDAFLERRPEFLEVGKLAIAACLIPYENESRLFDSIVKEQNWYEYLFQRLSSGAPDIELFCENQVTFITYNYDRSLEQFLTLAMSNNYADAYNQLPAIWKKIPIIHLHGALGRFLYDSDGGNVREYTSLLERKAVEIAAAEIRIIHETIDDEPQFLRAHAALKAAETVIFLGFGFHRKNLQRLRLEETTCNSFFATIIGMEGAEINHLQSMFAGRSLSPAALSIVQFLRTRGLLLEMPKSIFSKLS